MKRPSAFFVVSALITTRAVSAEPTGNRGIFDTGLAYAFPMGSMERGSRLSDITSGAPTVSLSALLPLNRMFSTGIRFAYGLVLPKLCASSSDCMSSIGSDLQPQLVVRWNAPHIWHLEPALDASFGYEWLSARLSDKDVVSARSLHGPAYGLAAQTLWAVSDGFLIGGSIGLTGGTFVRSALSAPGVNISRSADGRMIHYWPTIGFVAELRPK